MRTLSVRNTLVLLVLIFLTTTLLYSLIQPSAPSAKSYSYFESDVKAGNVKTIERNDTTLTITDNDGSQYTAQSDSPESGEWAVIAGWNPPNLKALTYTVDQASDNSWLLLLGTTVVPLLLLGFLLFFIMRQARGANSQIMGFGKSRARMFLGNKTAVTFDDVAGVDEAKTELQEVIEFLKYPEKFNALGARIPRGVLLVGSAGTGKCITGDSLILTDRGLIQIADIPRKYAVDDKTHKVHGARLVSFDPEEIQVTNSIASHWHDLGTQQTRRIRLDAGLEIEGTPEHPILVMSPDGYLHFQRLDKTEIGDQVAIASDTQCFGSRRDVDEETAYIMGLLTGDGCLTIQHRFAFTSADAELVKIFTGWVERKLGATVKKPKANRPYDYWVFGWEEKKKMLDTGLSAMPSFLKEVPPTILEAPREIQIAFLQGLFDADGWMQRRDSLFGFSTVSPRLCQQVATMLINFGVEVRVHRKIVKSQRGTAKPANFITLSGVALDTFATQINLGLPRKRIALEEALQKRSKENTNVLMIPNVAHLVETAWQRLSAANHSTSHLAELMSRVRERRRITRPSMALMLQAFREHDLTGEDVEQLQKLSASSLYFSPVIGITEGKAKVYDFTVPDTHTFIANGLISHNTLMAKATAGEAGVPFFSISGSEFVEMFVGVGASVTGDTPVLMRTMSGIELIPIAEFVDRYYEEGVSDRVVFVKGVETLGYEPRPSGSREHLNGFERSAWKSVGGVFRHRVDEIYEIEYPGGKLRTTGDHSVFVQGYDGIKAKPTLELQPGDVLIGLPSKVQDVWASIAPGTVYPVRADSFPEIPLKAQGAPKRSVVRGVTKLPYDGYVYDLVGCENEAFFGGESPMLLHNSRMRDIFDQAKRNAPAIIFVDEIDAVGRQRGTGLGGSHDEREQTLNQMLVEMDGFDTNTNVIVMAATNRPDVLDPALLRPGRFDRQVILDRPDLRGRIAILKVHIKGKPLDKAISLETLARTSAGMSGADLANLVNEAAILAGRRGRKAIGMAEFREALERIMAGTERKSRVISDEEKRIIAVHEGGHAVVQRILPKCDPVHKVTIISRGMALGYTMALPTEDRYLQSKSEFEDKIAGLLAGNAAERLVFGDTTTGASNDIEKATTLARRMVTEWGMSERMGPLSFGKRDEMVFLGREIGEQRNYSDDVAKMIDDEVRVLIENGYTRATAVLTEYRWKLMALADKLIAQETVESEEFEKLFADIPPKEDMHGIVPLATEAADVPAVSPLPAVSPVPPVPPLSTPAPKLNLP